MEADTIEQEVPYQQQADMAVKLHDNVTELIRDEIKKALNDREFLNTLNTYELAVTMLANITSQPMFGSAVRQVVRSAIDKAY